MATESTAAFWAKTDKYLMSTGVPYSPVIITKAKGTKLYDAEGRQILDFTSGQMSSLLGHSHPEIVEVVQKYVAELDHLLSNMITQPVADLAERLGKLLPAPLEKSFFLNTGSETTEAAIKMAKLHTGKFEIVAMSASYHGLTSERWPCNAGPTRIPRTLRLPFHLPHCRRRLRLGKGDGLWLVYD
ncbi:aminotransferase class III [Colletotrichum scovillei]|uniref:aminotransferase class III n=1 Tax=Colletotrichum scovillei TaxID=1209932 RepID=UPI0015C32B69|nr:aminotransferase class III [Colletotrichum scovillei]KAF4784376.1 aminotransferase class III [Colletotrichum scovillei]